MKLDSCHTIPQSRVPSVISLLCLLGCNPGQLLNEGSDAFKPELCGSFDIIFGTI